MIHNEHFQKADDSYEVRHDGNGNAIHVYIKDGEAIVFPTMYDCGTYLYIRDNDIERFYILEENLEWLYSHAEYNYYKLKDIYQSVKQFNNA